MKKLTPWLYALAIAVFSALLMVYAHDIEHDIAISPSSTQAGRQAILVSAARFLGFKASVVVGILATGSALYVAIRKQWARDK